jgi:hypothetical protein
MHSDRYGIRQSPFELWGLIRLFYKEFSLDLSALLRDDIDIVLSHSGLIDISPLSIPCEYTLILRFL